MDIMIVKAKHVLRVEVELKFLAGTDIDTAFEEALDVCVLSRQNVWFSFNGKKYNLFYDNLLKSFNQLAKS